MPVFTLIREFERAERMSKDELIAYQWRKLQRLIKHAVSFSPYYRELFSKIGAEPEDIKDTASFKQIPVLTKKIIRARGEDILATPHPRFLNEAKTSGSTGQPLKIFKDPVGRASTYAAMYRGHMWHGVDVGAKEARLWNVPGERLNRGKTKIKDIALNRFRQNNSQANVRTFAAFYQKMKRFHPEYLMGYPSLIYQFARYLAKVGGVARTLKLLFVKCTAEVIYDYQKELIEEVFGCPCISEYGSTESGIISFECPARKQHLMTYSVFVEFIENDFPVHNAAKKIITTNLHNMSFPIIRYDIGDFGCPEDGICDCGRPLPMIKHILGRTHDIIIGANGERFHSSILSDSLKELIAGDFPLKEIRFVQKERGKIQINLIESDGLLSEHIELTRETIQELFKGYIKVEIEKISEMPRDPSGKFGYFISHLNNNE